MTTEGGRNPYEKYHFEEDEDNYDPHCFFSSGLAQNRRRLGFIATCSSVQCKDAGSAGYDPLLPFKEDLAEWLYKMIRAEIAPERFFQELQSGVYLCRLGIHMQKMAVKYRKEHPEDKSLVPAKPPILKYANATRKSPPFYCRDNISNFLDWSIAFGVKPSCRFETDDLTMRKNDRQIVIHLMEVGRLGVKYGIEPPTLIKLEMALEEPMAPPPKGASTLDEKVQALAAECNCSVPFKVNRVSEGRYKVGEGRSIVFVRVLRSHVMVRVGGGWETLAAYFSKMDPCRIATDSFGRGGSNTNRAKQRFESNEDCEPVSPQSRLPPAPVSPQRSLPPAPVSPQSRLPPSPVKPEPVEVDSAPPPAVVQEAVAPVRAAPPAKPTRPRSRVLSPEPTRKPAAPMTRSASAKAPVPRPDPRQSMTSPTPRPAIVPRQTKASLLRTSSPSAIKTSAPTASRPPWKFVPNKGGGAPSPLNRSASAPQKPASRVSGEAGPSTPNFQQPNHASTLDRTVPPTQNKRLIPVGGKSLPKSDKYNRGTQRTPGKPKITSPELIRRAMEIMKDNGEVPEVEKEEVLRKPSNSALEAAIGEIAEEEIQCEASENVDVELPDTLADSGVSTLAESKPIRVTENATLGDSSVPFLSGNDTLQDISDMLTDDQDEERSELDHVDDLPIDEPGYEVHDMPTHEMVVQPIEVFAEDIAVESASIPVVESALEAALAPAVVQPDSDYEGGTTEDELNEAVGADGYVSRFDSSSSTSGQDTSSGYHEDYETSDGDELGSNYNKVPDVIMEQDKHTRSILKGSTRDSDASSKQSLSSSKQSLSSTPSLPKQEQKDDDDEVFEEQGKGLHLPTEGHVREAVFTKAIEEAIKPLAYDVRIPGVFDLQSASIVLPSKKAIKKASDGEYDYQGRRTNLEKVISRQHTERTDMQWEGDAHAQDQTDGQTRDEKVYKWSGTLRSSQKKKKPFRTKKFSEDDILNAITQQASAVRSTCPVHSKDPHAPIPSGNLQKKRSTPTKRPTTGVSRKAPVSRTAKPTTATTPASSAVKTMTAVKTTKTPLKTAPKTAPTPSTKARQPVRRVSSTPLFRPRPVVQGSKAIAVKPASHVSTPQEVMGHAGAGAGSGPLSPSLKTKIKVTKSTPIKRATSLRASGSARRTPLKSSNSLPRDKIRSGPTCHDLP